MKLSFWDILASMIMLAGLALATIFVNIFVNPYTFINPFPPPTQVIALDLPTLTPSPRSLPELWTATPETTESTLFVTVTPSATPSQTGTVLVLPTGTATRTRTASPSPSKSVTNTPNRTLTSVAFKSPTKTDVPDTSTSVVKTSTQTPCSITGGYCDDANPRVNYVGVWSYYVGSGPYNNTLHFSRQVGATADYGFNGTKVSYFFTTYRNRGHARIYIDGVHAADISEYSSGSSSVWQQRWDSAVLPAGYHNITVEVLDGYIDIDAFYVNWSGAAITNTPAPAIPLPIVTTNAATAIDSSSSTLNGVVNANGNSTTVSFQYGTTTAYGTTVAGSPSPVTGSANTSVSAAVSGLTPGTLYHFRAVGVNGGGTQNGADATFTTLKADQTINITSSAPVGAVYGDPDYTVTATATSGLPVTLTIDGTSSGVCTISGNDVSITGVGNCSINANQAGNSNYNAAPQVQQSFTIAKADQSITFTSTPPVGSVDVGDPDYVVTATASSSLVVTFSLDGASVGCSISGSTVTYTGTGTCLINADQAGNANFNAAPQEQQSITVN